MGITVQPTIFIASPFTRRGSRIVVTAPVPGDFGDALVKIRLPLGEESAS